MASTPRITTYTSGEITATNAAYSSTYKLTIPFKADRVVIKVVSSSGSPNLVLSFDGTNDAATLHHNTGGPGSEHTFSLQEVDTLYYKQTGTDCHFIVNAETKAWPSVF